jgi:hypothetical protein
MIEVPTAQPRKIPSTTLTNKYAEAINTLGQLFKSGTGLDQAKAILVVRVKVIGNEPGGGKYTGRILNAPVSGVDATSDLSAADLGDDPGANNAMILNAQEVGQTTHTLTDTTDGGPHVTIFLGMFYGYSTTGKCLVMINGDDWTLDCPTP